MLYKNLYPMLAIAAAIVVVMQVPASALAASYAVTAAVTLLQSTQTSVSVNYKTNTIYATNSLNNTVSVINGATNTIISNVKVGIRPVTVAVNTATNETYVSNRADNCPVCGTIDGGSVSILNKTNGVATTVGIDSPWGIGVNTVTNKVYVTESVNGAVDVISGSTHTITKRITGIGTNPTNIAVDTAHNKVYVTDPGSSAIYVIDGSTDTLSATLQNSQIASPVGIAYDPNSGRIFITNTQLGDGYVTVINAATSAVVTTITFSKVGEPYFIVVNTNKNEAYVTNVLGNELGIIATDTLSIKQHLASGLANVEVCGADINPTTGTIYVGVVNTQTQVGSLLVIN